MDNQPQQRFCTNCGQPLAPGTAFCLVCGTPTGAPPMGAVGQFSPGAQPGYSQSSMQSPMQTQDDLLLAGLVAGSAANQARQNRQRQARRPLSWLRGCGCLLLILAVLIGPFLGVALTNGRPHLIFTYVAGGMVVLFFLVLLIGMLATRRGREAILGGFLGGG